MAKKSNSIHRFLSDRVDIIIMPRAGAARKWKLSGLTLLLLAAAWLGLTLGALWLWSKAYDYHLTRADNKLMRVKMQLISDELERGRKYLTSVSVHAQASAFATGVLPDIYRFHPYTWNSDFTSVTLAIQFSMLSRS